MDEVVENSRPLLEKMNETVTRLSLFEMRYPRTVYPLRHTLLHLEHTMDVASLHEDSFMPPEDMIRIWKTQLSAFDPDVNEKSFPYVKCSFPSGEKIYDYNSLEKVQTIHRLQNIKSDVKRELDWFSEEYDIPVVLQKRPSQESISAFQKVLYESPYNLEVPGYGMVPDELAKLCCERWLTSDHMYWFSEKINCAQQSTVCCYLNHVSNVERFAAKLLSSHPDTPTCVLFLINVGRDGDHVYVGEDAYPGIHWTICVVARDGKNLYYGDSLGWKMPNDLLQRLQPYLTSLWSENIAEYSIQYCHDPVGTSDTGHACLPTCSPLYPLQRDSSICGVVVLLMAGLVFADKPSFHYMLSNEESRAGSASISFRHLSDPTKFSCYLRRVLIAWFVEGTFDSRYLLPTCSVAGSENVQQEELPDEMSGTDHQEKVQAVNLTCPECGEKCSKLFNLKRHFERQHPEGDVTILDDLGSGMCSCLSCPFKCFRMKDFRRHLSGKHGLIFRTENISFSNYSEFKEWKKDQEESEDCSFVKVTGNKEINKDNVQAMYFQCNRSGCTRSGNSSDKPRKRRVKSQGTSKIATNCTSTMTVQLDLNGKVSVNVCYTHYGHGKSLEHLRVPTRQRDMIAAKIKNGVSRQRILDDIRESVSKAFHRQHLIDRQDLANIERAFDLQNVQRHSNDLQSVLAWISEWKSDKGEESPVLYLKLQGEEAKVGYDLPIDDFLLVVQTPFQREMLQKFAVNGICCDSTHGTNGYDFPLTTIHVIDEFGEGMPVAWCLSNHEDFSTMVVFFSEIKKRCGTVENAFFMSDMANQFYNAWVAVMGPRRPAKLLCTWHVDKAWKEELRRKVGDVILEAEMYKLIRTCLEQTSENRFEDCLSGLLNYLESEPKAECFRNYFAKEWVSKKTQWAYCFRLRMGINTNMFSEAFHRVFKRLYLGGKTNKRIDNCLVNLVKFSRDKAFDRGIKLTKGKQTYRILSTMAGHRESLGIPDSLVQKLTGDKWLVSCQTSSRKHEVYMVAPTCVDKDQCKMVCPDCKVCPHLFQCDCSDWLIKGIICKHVHAVRRVNLATVPHQQDMSSISNELKSLSSYVKERPLEQTARLKESIKGKLESLEHEIELCDDLEALQTLNKQLNAASSAFSAFSKYGHLPNQPSSVVDSHANKKMETQRRFYSTKKKRVKRVSVRYTRPTWEEKETYQTILTASKPSGSSKTSHITRDLLETLHCIASQSAVTSLVASGTSISNADLKDDELPGEFLDSSKFTAVQKYLTPDAWTSLQRAVADLNVSWTCSKCKIAEFTEMIACDQCDNWYHWACVGVTEEPESWACAHCQNPKRDKVD